MSIADQNRIKSLEERIAELEKRPVLDYEVLAAVVKQLIDSATLASAPMSKEHKLCPKCGEQPAYFFHVRSCKGPKQKEQAVNDQGRTT